MSIQDEEVESEIYWSLPNRKSGRWSGLSIGVASFYIHTTWYISCISTSEIYTRFISAYPSRYSWSYIISHFSIATQPDSGSFGEVPKEQRDTISESGVVRISPWRIYVGIGSRVRAKYPHLFRYTYKFWGRNLN